jgi:non-canonical (house-cleaning) NTP pyrophosphatase
MKIYLSTHNPDKIKAAKSVFDKYDKRTFAEYTE